MKEIVQEGHPSLRTDAAIVSVENIISDEIQSIIHDMQESLTTQKDGVALAAPQIGVEKQIFVVAPFLFEAPEEEHLVYINPKIVHQGKKVKWKEEGCLSCRWKVGEVERHLETTVTAFNEFGVKFTETGTDLLAHIFQHEIDHLHSTLFIDKARNLRDMSEKEIKKAQS